MELDFGGNKWKVTQMKIGDVLAFKDFKRTQKLKEIIEICKQLDGIDKDAMIRQHLAEKNELSAILTEALSNGEGIVFLIWRSVLRNHDVTLEQVANALPMKMEELQPIIEAIMGTPINPTIAPAGTPEPETKTETN